MRMHLRYLSYVIRHKWFVLVAGLRTGAPLWRLLIHDWSKFLPSEWFGYAHFFYGGEKTPARRAAFDEAWLHHQKRNAHHWQYWVLMEDQPKQRYRIVSMDGGMLHHALTEDDETLLDLPQLAINLGREGDDRYHLMARCARDANRHRALPMPESYVREMVADWMGAGRAITGKWEAASWYCAHRESMVLHPTTRALVERLLEGAA